MESLRCWPDWIDDESPETGAARFAAQAFPLHMTRWLLALPPACAATKCLKGEGTDHCCEAAALLAAPSSSGASFGDSPGAPTPEKRHLPVEHGSAGPAGPGDPLAPGAREGREGSAVH